MIRDLAIIAGTGLLHFMAVAVILFVVVSAIVMVALATCGTVAFWAWLFFGQTFAQVCLR